jgi:trans-feruloyl-CoA hydratase/vanillin synthase
MNNSNEPWGNTVLVEFEGPIAWVYFNRPDKRNSMSPTLNREMFATLRALEIDDRCQLVVLTGTGEAWSAGMDLKEYFRETDNASDAVKSRTRRETADWQWRTLRDYLKPTIAMVNGWCFGGAFTPLVACDLAVAADDATFGLSEVNWGILPAGMVTKVVADTIVLRNAKELYKRIGNLDWDTANDYIYAKADASQQQSGGRFRKGALKAFLDDKMLKPGLQTFEEDDKDQAV